MISNEHLAKTHTGMRVSFAGLLKRICKKVDRVTRDESIANMKETADRFYKGDIQVVDEFFQIYALDNNRPKQLTQKECGK